MSKMKRITETLKKFFNGHYLGFIIITATILSGAAYFYLDYKIHGGWAFARSLSGIEMLSYFIVILLCGFVIVGGILSDRGRLRRIKELENIKKANFIENVAMKIITEPSFDKKVYMAANALRNLVSFEKLYVILEKDGKFSLIYPEAGNTAMLHTIGIYPEEIKMYVGKFYKGYYILKIDLYDYTGYVLLFPISPITDNEKQLLEKYKKIIEPLFGNARLILAIKKSKNRVEKLLGRYKMMHRFILKSQEAGTYEEVYWTIVVLARTFFDSDFTFVLDTNDPDSKNWKIVAIKNVPESVVNFFNDVFLEKQYISDNFIFEVVHSKKPLFINDLQDYSAPGGFDGILKEINSYLGIPFIIDDKVVAVLNIWSKEGFKFNSEDMIFAYMLSDIVSSILVRIRYLEKLDEYSVTDSLTGIYNKREFYKRIFEEIKRSSMYNKKLSVVIFDLDGFKEWNDTYGHLEGDKVLKELGNLLKERLRNTDIPFRFGGDEFVIIMPDTSADNAGKAMEDISFRVKELILDKRKKITLSIGIAEYKPNETVEEFIERADKAMYAAKNAGKNKIKIAN